MPRLTKRYIDALKPDPGAQYFRWDDALKGFGVRVSPGGTKAFVVQSRPEGSRQSKTKTLGRYGRLTPQKARELAGKELNRIERGENPFTRDVTVKDAVERYIRIHLSRRSARHRQETERLLRRHILPAFGHTAVTKLRRPALRRVTDDLNHEGKAALAVSVHRAVKAFLSWCVDRELIDVNPLAGAKPPANVAPRERVLSEDELRALLHAAGTGFPFGAWFRLLVLTGARREEVAGMAWPEVDRQKRQWVIPAERAKNRQEHTVHLSDEALAVLDGLSDSGGLVFSTTGDAPISGFSRFKARLDRESGVTDWVFHDLRRTLVTKLAGLGIPPHVCDAILAHKSSTIRGVARAASRSKVAR